MNNLGHAAKTIAGEIAPSYPECRAVLEICGDCQTKAIGIANALTDAGLLAPDLPAPLTAANGNPVWRADNTLMVTRYPDGEIGMLVGRAQEARYIPQTARTQAALLLAAANHAEEGNRE